MRAVQWALSERDMHDRMPNYNSDWSPAGCCWLRQEADLLPAGAPMQVLPRSSSRLHRQGIRARLCSEMTRSWSLTCEMPKQRAVADC